MSPNLRSIIIMRAIDLAVLEVNTSFRKSVESLDEEGDWKDSMASGSQAYCDIMDELSVRGITMKTRVPDGYSCPRAFSDWSDSEFINELTAIFAGWSRTKRKERKLELRLR